VSARPAVATLILVLAAFHPADAQQTSNKSPWVIGTAFGLTSDPPTAFFEGPYTAPTNGPHDLSGWCLPKTFVSFGFLAGRRLSSWLRTDVAAAAHVESNQCNIATPVSSGPGDQGSVWVEYRGRTPNYAHSTLIARVVAEKQDGGGLRPRIVAGAGCICEKRIPLAQVGLGLSAGSSRTRWSLEAGGQISHFTWTRVIMPEYRPPEPLIVIETEKGTSTPRQFWVRVGFEYTPSSQQ
jgi:hypothetical protein